VSGYFRSILITVLVVVLSCHIRLPVLFWVCLCYCHVVALFLYLRVSLVLGVLVVEIQCVEALLFEMFCGSYCSGRHCRLRIWIQLLLLYSDCSLVGKSEMVTKIIGD
jgi:hypothetical protein